MQKTLINKTAKLFSIASLFLFSGIVVFALQTASGWTNPSSNPPGAPGALYYSNGNVGVGTNNPTSTLSVNGVISAMGNKVVDVANPTADKDAVNLGYLQTQISAAGAGSGGSVVLFYKTIDGAPSGSSSCPATWTEQYRGYGPHFIGLLSYDYLYNNASGYQSEGGFGGAAPLGQAPPASGSSYTLKSVAFGADSVCSMNSESVVPMYQFYSNTISADAAGLYANACGTFNSSTYCNRCVVCTQ